MSGILYGVGIGPGDPELITMKAVRIIKESNIIAVPRTGESTKVALSIVEAAGLDLSEKNVIPFGFPMTKDKEELDNNRDKIAKEIVEILDSGENVAFLTLGDPTIYSTYIYIHQRVLAMGRKATLISGVPSFCAVAARLNEGLVEADEPLIVIPASYEETSRIVDMYGTKVLMKSGKQLHKVKQMISDKGLIKKAKLVQNCGLENESVYEDLENSNEDLSYFSIIVVK